MTVLKKILYFFNLRRDFRFISAKAVPVEPIAGQELNPFIFSQPFAFASGKLELLQKAGDEVFYERNGIYYISNNVFAYEKSEEELDSNFVTLVESVINV